jgi:hypothetical protein
MGWNDHLDDDELEELGEQEAGTGKQMRCTRCQGEIPAGEREQAEDNEGMCGWRHLLGR